MFYIPRRSYVTSMPDKAGAFLLASRIIAGHSGNIVRVSFNKAVDLHTLFIDVEAGECELDKIGSELEGIGYLNNRIPEVRVIVVDIRIPDVPGAVLPVLQILERYNINISYMNSVASDTPYQRFKMGLLIEDPGMVKKLLDDISRVYPLDIMDYDDVDKNLDNTIFYIRQANEMQRLLSLSADKTMEFISESNRIFQMFDEKGDDPGKVFDYVRRFAHFISRHRGENFTVDIEKVSVTDSVDLYSIQPPCGSNTYVLDIPGELVLIDTGYAIYAGELLSVLKKLFPDWSRRVKRVFITHADVDHCGLLSALDDAEIWMNEKSAASLCRQYAGEPDYREANDFSFGYSRLSRIISGYVPPDPSRFHILDSGTPSEHDGLLPIAAFNVSGMEFEVLEGSGGHLLGEMVFVCRANGVIFTGDDLVNISGFSPERAEFNSLAPYLMRSVNMDSVKATVMRRQIIQLIEMVEEINQKPCLVCGGHGPLSILENGKLITASGLARVEKVLLDQG